ncbi:MAG TPA: hypothetical protein VMM12_14435 [Longimicrobiales bacterium]|nr:hypothetical protein [Longimicrobiales bacterium]
MRRPFRRHSSLVDQTREQLHIATAVAGEAVLTEHVRFALELLDEAGDRVPLERILGAYGRLHYLKEGELRQLTERVLVALGRDPEGASRARLQPPRSIFRRAAHRFRGRVHTELREWVDRHAARVELAVLEVHVHNALRFAHILFDAGSPEEAVEIYADTMALRPTMAEMVRLRVLAEAPVHGEDPSPETVVEPLHPRLRAPLRLAEDGG